MLHLTFRAPRLARLTCAATLTAFVAVWAAALGAPDARAQFWYERIEWSPDDLRRLARFPQDPAPLSREMIGAVLAACNQKRAEHGLTPLRANASLARLADDYSRAMLRGRFFGHVSPDGRSLRDRIPRSVGERYATVGENLWTGEGDLNWTAPALSRHAARNWMESPSHREALLDPDYRDTGIGVAIANGRIYIAMLFGEPQRPGVMMARRRAPIDLAKLEVNLGGSTPIAAPVRTPLSAARPAPYDAAGPSRPRTRVVIESSSGPTFASAAPETFEAESFAAPPPDALSLGAPVEPPLAAAASQAPYQNAETPSAPASIEQAYLAALEPNSSPFAASSTAASQEPAIAYAPIFDAAAAENALRRALNAARAEKNLPTLTQDSGLSAAARAQVAAMAAQEPGALDGAAAAARAQADAPLGRTSAALWRSAQFTGDADAAAARAVAALTNDPVGAQSIYDAGASMAGVGVTLRGSDLHVAILLRQTRPAAPLVALGGASGAPNINTVRLDPAPLDAGAFAATETAAARAGVSPQVREYAAPLQISLAPAGDFFIPAP